MDMKTSIMWTALQLSEGETERKNIKNHNVGSLAIFISVNNYADTYA